MRETEALDTQEGNLSEPRDSAEVVRARIAAAIAEPDSTPSHVLADRMFRLWDKLAAYNPSFYNAARRYRSLRKAFPRLPDSREPGVLIDAVYLRLTDEELEQYNAGLVARITALKEQPEKSKEAQDG